MLDVDSSVRERYSRGAREREAELCCPVDYDPRFLAVIPPEIIERDYGCGDPSRHLLPGDTVLDLGSGGGKICYISSQVVGAGGRVIGVDVNPEMLALARSHQNVIAGRIGWSNVEFRRGRIQDLRLDLDAVDGFLARSPVASAADLERLESFTALQRAEKPLVADASVDVVVSNCVLNLVRDDDKRNLVREIFRVLRDGGRAVISDIVCDEPVPHSLKDDPELWSGCLSGAFLEADFLDAFVDAGFYGVEILERGDAPWQTVAGIEFRSMTLRAWKGKEGACWDRGHAVIYRGPWSEVRDDDGHVLRRGETSAVCEKSFRLLTSAPYAEDTIGLVPNSEVSAAVPFDCSRDRVRTARELKGAVGKPAQSAAACGESSGCC
jgi:SAM-dependent methyltransferase